MPLRIRCPKCGTVQRVPAGVRPTCQKCGFAGNAAASASAATEPAASTEPDAQPGQVQWGEQAGQQPGQVAWDQPAAAATTGAGEQAEEWPDAGEGDAAWPQADVPEGEAPKKKGLFGRAK